MAKCAFCGRETRPFVMIGAEAVGPTCARKAGLTKAKEMKGNRIRFVGQPATGPRAPVPVTMDLFEGLDDEKA